MLHIEIEVQDKEIINLASDGGEVVLLMLGVVDLDGEVDDIETRAMNKKQVDALIKGLQKAKETLD